VLRLRTDPLAINIAGMINASGGYTNGYKGVYWKAVAKMINATFSNTPGVKLV
jgi:hypothetical protein